MLEEGRTVIYLKTQEEAYIVKIIEGSIKPLYVIETTDHEFHITDEMGIVLYDSLF